MQRSTNQFVVFILVLCLSGYSNIVFAQPGKQGGHYGFNNSLTANIGVGVFCGEIGAGGGVEYQRFIDKGGHLSLDLKATIFTSGTIGEADDGETRINIKARYLGPGARYHFTGNARVLDFSLGIFVPIGTLTRREHYVASPGGPKPGWEITTTGFLSGIVGQVVLDIRSQAGFTIGPFVNIGALFTTVRALNGSSVQPLCFSFGLRVGGCW